MTLFSFEHSKLALKKAFDAVDHSILLKKLILLNILLKEFQMNGYYLTHNSFQSVIISQVLKQVFHRALFLDPSFFYYM